MKKLLLVVMLAMAIVPMFAMAQGACSPTYSGPNLCNAIPGFGDFPITDIQSFIKATFIWLAGIIATLALVVLIYSGIRMVFSQGEPDALQQAKTSFTYAIIGFIVTVFGYVIVSGTQYLIGVRSGNPEEERNFFYNPIGFDDLPSFVGGLISSSLGLIGTVVMLYLVWNGFKYMTAGGNDDRLKSAKNGITWSIYGLISIMLSYTVVMVLMRLFRS